MTKDSRIIIKECDKMTMYFDLMTRWLRLRQYDRRLVEYFEHREMHTLAIYGLGKMGQALIRELDNSQLRVVAGIDRQLDIYTDFPIYRVAPSEMEVDVIVVTATFFYNEIKQDLKEIVGSTPIVSLEDIIIECEEKYLKYERGL